MTTMSSNRPYLIRAFYDWIVDNGCTPYVVVDAYKPGVEVPQDYVSDGQIVLNLTPRAVVNFHLDRERLAFNTRFGGIPTDINIPLTAVLGIYARENGQGMVFQSEDGPQPPESPGPGKGSATIAGSASPREKSRGGQGQQRPNLKIIK